jgi:hypothetical protein
MKRPDCFILNQNHALAKNLVFGGMGNYPNTKVYRDSSVYNNHGNFALINGWKYNTILNRWCINFIAGASNFIQFPKFVTCSSTRWTFACWILTTPGGGGIIGASNYVNISNSSGNLVFCDNSYCYFIPFFPFTTLGHLTITFNAGVWTIYRNGVYYATNIPTSYNATWGTATKIGSSSLGYLTGTIGDIMIYDRVLSKAEIFQLASLDPMLGGFIVPPLRNRYLSTIANIPLSPQKVYNMSGGSNTFDQSVANRNSILDSASNNIAFDGRAPSVLLSSTKNIKLSSGDNTTQLSGHNHNITLDDTDTDIVL